MPFDYDKYQEKCNGMTAEQLQKEWENYTRQMSAGATSTATSVLLMPLTGGISAVGLGLSAPRIHNARKKREIIEAGLKARGTTHRTRTGDVLAPMAVSGIIGGLTLGLAPHVEAVATNTALTATEAVVVSNARKKMANEAKLNDLHSPEQNTRYGSMALPFLMEEAVLAFQHPVHQQFSQPPNGVEQSATVVQGSHPSTGDIKIQMTNMHIQQDPTASLPFSSLSIHETVNARTQTTDNQAGPATSEATLFASIPSYNLNDVPYLASVDEEDMLKMHALALAMEKYEEDEEPVGFDLSEFDPHATIQGNAGQNHTPQLTPPTQLQLLERVDGNQAKADETASHVFANHSVTPEERPGHPPRQAPRAATLPARFNSPQAGLPNHQDGQYPPQSLPRYQPQYFSTNYQAAEPQQYQPSPEPQQRYPTPQPQRSYTPPQSQQPYLPPDSKQYYPPPPPQQRQDSGYVSMHSTHSVCSTPQQTYYPPSNNPSPQMCYPPPNFVSRHSSIPQSYQNPPPIGHNPMPYHPGDPNAYHQQVQMNQGHRGSESSLYPMTPPPPYYTPPPGMASAPVTAGKENDYFNYATAPPQPAPSLNSSQYNTSNPLLEQPQKLVDGMNKGWQWARAVALPTKTPLDSKFFVEPNYGPSPAVPTAWRGS